MDADGDKLGIAVVHGKKTSLGQWQRRSSKEETWQDIDIDANTDDYGFLEGDTAQLLFLLPSFYVRFKAEPGVKPWTNADASDYTSLRFVLWDQTDQLTPGLHTISLEGTYMSVK